MHSKLVRDKVPEIIQLTGQVPFIHKAENGEYRQLLLKKLLEETEEYVSIKSEEELADILEVINAICSANKIDMSQLEKLRQKKAKEKGTYSNKNSTG